ncbi:MAG: Mut7-C RNAse domain-containing protein [Candidatus Eisenbacteria bacterium]
MLPARFLTDASLDRLARWLRFLGYDVLTHRGARLEELFELAARDGRTVLTQSPRHPKRYADIPAMQVPRDDDALALRRIVAAHEATTAPFTRCPICNDALMERSAFEARGEVPGRVTRGGSPLRYCPSCSKWFWVGSHVARIIAWLEDALGRSIGIPLNEPPGPPNSLK